MADLEGKNAVDFLNRMRNREKQGLSKPDKKLLKEIKKLDKIDISDIKLRILAGLLLTPKRVRLNFLQEWKELEKRLRQDSQKRR